MDKTEATIVKIGSISKMIHGFSEIKKRIKELEKEAKTDAQSAKRLNYFKQMLKGGLGDELIELKNKMQALSETAKQYNNAQKESVEASLKNTMHSAEKTKKNMAKKVARKFL